MSRFNSPVRAQVRQSGAALIVVMLLLLAMTLLGLATLRGTIMEERMSANMYDRSLGFQAAEAALREAENRLLQPGTLASFPNLADSCSPSGLCSTPVSADGKLERADDPDFDGWVSAAPVSSIAGSPEYFIEYMDEAPGWPMCDREIPRHASCMRPRYRITARSTADGRSTIILQANFAGS